MNIKINVIGEIEKEKVMGFFKNLHEAGKRGRAEGAKLAEEKRRKEHEELMRRLQEANNCNKKKKK